jgi:DNA-directed RNA polymerase subunit N (RpoN/RPB10)
MNNWIRLLVKYKGKCSTCGKEISAGQYALWSKSSKAIKHIECKAPASATAEKKDPDTNRQQPTAAEVDCFICGRPVAGNNNSGFPADDYGRQAISHASICNRCLEDKNAYLNYQHAFLEKVQRVAKVKL